MIVSDSSQYYVQSYIWNLAPYRVPHKQNNHIWTNISQLGSFGYLMDSAETDRPTAITCILFFFLIIRFLWAESEREDVMRIRFCDWNK